MFCEAACSHSPWHSHLTWGGGGGCMRLGMQLIANDCSGSQTRKFQIAITSLLSLGFKLLLRAMTAPLSACRTSSELPGRQGSRHLPTRLHQHTSPICTFASG